MFETARVGLVDSHPYLRLGVFERIATISMPRQVRRPLVSNPIGPVTRR